MQIRHAFLGVVLVGALLLTCTSLFAQEANVPVQEFTLDNGMRLLLVERHDSPSVSAGWVAHAGSANETYGITGIAHLFEHMMFKGSKTVATSDYPAEAEIMSQLDAIRIEMDAEYTALREAKRRGEVSGSIYLPENATEKLGVLREKMKTLQEQQKAFIVKDEFDKIYTSLGASGMNAGTNSDVTVYFITVPANKTELWFWMESERLMNPVFREFYSERDVVREERRQRVESNPTARYEEQFDAMFWTAGPYHHPTIGWPSDVESISRAQANDFFSTYYAPNNITAVLVGDFDASNVVELATKYLGRIPRGAKEPPEVVTEEVEQVMERRMHAQADTNPSVQIRWHTVSFVHKDSYALDMLADILRGRTGRFFKSLVEESQMATGEPYAVSSAMKYAGSFEVGAELADGHSHQEVEATLLAEIERLKKEPVSANELQKVKNGSLADSFRRLQSNFFLTLQLLFYDGLGDWHYLNESPAKFQSVTAEDVMAVANTYFTETGRNILWYSRKDGTTEDPELAALSGQAKQFASQMLKQIAANENIEELKAGLEQMTANLGQAPDEFKPALELVLKKLTERIEILGAAAGEEE